MCTKLRITSQSPMVTITRRYLCVPSAAGENGRETKLLMREAGELVYELDLYLTSTEWDAAEKDPDTRVMFVDCKRFLGKTLTFSMRDVQSGEETDFSLVMTDERLGAENYLTHLRPDVHFSARYGWTNDPNGLVYADSVYHMFYQHNPAGTRWGNMHWGHATSGDLIHWIEQDEVLFPDHHGTMFSGSAVADENNVSGLKNGEFTPILLFYTAAGGAEMSKNEPFQQFMAYSTDGGMTFRKYSDTPVVPHIAGANRDPKVVWGAEAGCWLMALYLDGHEYCLFRSDDLLHWTEFQRITLPEDAECPDFYPLVCQETGDRLWIFSGASDTYLVGQLAPNGFFPLQEALPYRLGGGGSYAAQTFQNLGDRVVKIAWGQSDAPGADFNSQMLLPVDVTLHRTDDRRYRLATNPIPALRDLYIMNTTFEKCASIAGPLRHTLRGSAYDITIRLGDDAPAMACSFYGITVVISREENCIRLPEREIPLSRSGENCAVRLIVDTLGIEVFSDGGLVYTAVPCLPDMTKEECVIRPVSGDKCGEVCVTFAPLYRIWP